NDPFPLETAEQHLRLLTETFFKGPFSEDYKRALKGSGESFAEGLRAMGADGVTVGLALMEDAWEPWPNPYRVIERLKKIAPADRLDVMVKSGLLAKLANWPLSADIRDLLRAYIWE